jgi:hypothetical protein
MIICMERIMRRRRRRAPARYRRDDYYSDEYYYSYPRRRRRGCLAPIQRFFRNVAIVLLTAVGAIVFFLVVLLIAFHLALFIQILVYLLFVAAGLAILGVLYLIVRIIAAIFHRISAASIARSKAKIERERVRMEKERVNQARNQVQLQQSKLAREEYAFYQKYDPGYYQNPRRTRVIRDEEPPNDQGPAWRSKQESPYRTRVLAQQDQVQSSATEEPSALEQLGMPPKGSIFAYRDYKRYLTKRGQLIVGVRRDGTPRIGTWQEFKIVLILGSSSSGKSTTVLEKCSCIVEDSGWLVVCDPGGFKPDSITKRLGSLSQALMPGTIIALEHEDIMKNIDRFRVELERRRRGAPIDIPILLVIDELNGILMDTSIKKELTKLLELLAQQARGYNMYMILCAQRVSGLAAIRNSVIAYICHKCPQLEASKILPASYAKLAPQLGVGQTFVTDFDGNIDALQQALITKQDLAVQRRTTPTVAQQPAALRRSRLAAQILPSSTASTVPMRPKPTKNLQQKPSPGATWSEEPGSEKLVLPSIPETQRTRQRLRDTDELIDHQVPAAQPDDITQQSQVPSVQQKLDRLTEMRASRRKKK